MSDAEKFLAEAKLMSRESLEEAFQTLRLKVNELTTKIRGE